MKIAKLVFIGTQEGFGRIPSVDLYNVMECAPECAQLPIGTTTTIKSVERLGYTVEIVTKENV